jgi:microcystin-dependent protein
MDPFLGEIRMFGGNFAPAGWALCNGQILAISQNTALFSLLGTQYGGNGQSTFALPNLQGLAPMHFGNGAGLTPRVIGETGGQSTVALLANQVPSHNHTFNCGSGSKGENSIVTNQFNCDEATGSSAVYATATDGTLMAPTMVVPLSASQPHENKQPYQCVNYIIALRGIFPSRG